MPVGALSSPAEPVAFAAASALGEILTPDEVADYLRVSKKTVYKLVRSGALPALKAGKHSRVRRADLGAWIASGSRESGRQSR